MRRRAWITGAAAGALAAGAVALGIALAPSPPTAKVLVVNPLNSGRPNIVQLTAQGDTPAEAKRAANTAARRYVAAHAGARVLTRAVVP